MQEVFANRNGKTDFIGNQMELRAESGSDIYIASAFFTDAALVEALLKKGGNIYLLVRFGFPTSPDAIKQFMDRPNIQLRYFTSPKFHPKLYIFGNESALVGSANLTGGAMISNQEVVVGIGADDDRFSELTSIFEGYWAEAAPVTEEALETYRASYNKLAVLNGQAEEIREKMLNKMGETMPSNIDHGGKKPNKQSLFFDDYQRAYQECCSAFDLVSEVYKATGYRKAAPADIPLRLEIDSFISYVRETHAQGTAWETAPLRSRDEQKVFIKELIEAWQQVSWPHFEQEIVGESYPVLMRVFGSRETILAVHDDELFDALTRLHSFYNRLRYFEGGLPTFKAEFFAANDPVHLRKTLAELIHGKGDVVRRMADVIYSPAKKLKHFGIANVQELVGWCNNDELPIINGRTTKVLRYFGSRVRPLS